jgi:putative ABC transport system substrate-binding protein
LRKHDDIPRAFERLRNGRVDAAIVSLDAFMIEEGEQIESQAALHRIPLIIPGGFGYKTAIINFGPEVSTQPRRAADYVARILEGAKPADLPVEMSQKYELAVNVRQAAALGIAIPETVLFRADRVIR